MFRPLIQERQQVGATQGVSLVEGREVARVDEQASRGVVVLPFHDALEEGAHGRVFELLVGLPGNHAEILGKLQA